MPLTKTELGLEDAWWDSLSDTQPHKYRCGFCGNMVASTARLQALMHGRSNAPAARLYLCPDCHGPTLFTATGHQFPLVPPGEEVPNLPADLDALYREARAAAGAGAHTAAVLVCRKILMHVGVEQGAEPNKSFVHYVEHLSEKGYIPPNGKGWVDHIRQRNNDANHEILLMDAGDAALLIEFVEMLLRFIYDFPNRVPTPTAKMKLSK